MSTTIPLIVSLLAPVPLVAAAIYSGIKCLIAMEGKYHPQVVRVVVSSIAVVVGFILLYYNVFNLDSNTIICTAVMNDSETGFAWFLFDMFTLLTITMIHFLILRLLRNR